VPARVVVWHRCGAATTLSVTANTFSVTVLSVSPSAFASASVSAAILFSLVWFQHAVAISASSIASTASIEHS
jgi:hypothetical protein